MTEPVQFRRITCPWCSETMEVEIDLSAGNQTYTEDCQICCAPIVLDIRVDGDNIACTAQRE